MLDIKIFRENPDLVQQGLRKRGMDDGVVELVLKLDAQRRELLTEVEALKSTRNKVSREIGLMKDKSERQVKIDEMRKVGDEIGRLDDNLSQVEEELYSVMSGIPNIPDDTTPVGEDESDNVVLKNVGEKPSFDFTPLPHWDLGPRLEILNFEQGAKITGSRFYVLSGAGARLQRALISWMLDLHIRQGYVEKYTPFMVRKQTMFVSGQLPKFEDNLYRDHEEDLWFIPTSEVTLNGLHMDEILEETNLPIRYTAYTPCFRREKMSAGRDVRGIKRGHQFDKVEMFTICKVENSEREFEKMLADAEQTVAELELTYRVSQLCSGDISFHASRTYDIEVWSPGCGEWLEVSSISIASDFQARRANIRYREEGGKNKYFLSTLNGSGLGLPRALAAVLENYQQADGSVIVPRILHPWMGGIEVINSG